MSAFLWWLMPRLEDRYGGSVVDRIWSLGFLVVGGLAVFFAAALVLGALDKDLLAQLRRRRPAQPVDLSE
jgi:putative peptidoglycan lipid II flippase